MYRSPPPPPPMPPGAFGCGWPSPGDEYDSDASERRVRRKSRNRRGSTSRAPSPITITYDKDGNRLHDRDNGNETLETLPDVVWRLAIHRRKRDDKSTTGRDHRVSYVGQKPFDIKLCTSEDVGLTSVRGSSKPYKSVQQPVFEVVTKVLDSRYTLKDAVRDADVRDLQISRVYGEEVKIWSEHIRKALAEIVTYYPAYPPHGFEKALEVEEPYALLMHHFPDIDALAMISESTGPKDANDDSSSTPAKHMALLRDFLKVQYECQVLPCISALLQETPKIRYDMLWYLFRPGDTVYVQGKEDVYACVMKSVIHNSYECALSMWCLDTDGARLGRRAREYTITRYAGLQKAVALPVCPTTIWDAYDGGAQRAQILRRNELYLKGLRAGSLYAHYKGKDVSVAASNVTLQTGANET